jgi:TonB-linked SusC/RagA family outer membrane protein
MAVVLILQITLNSFGQKLAEQTITGKVVNATTHQELVGMNVSLGTFSSAITDSQGRFSLKVNDIRATLIVSGVGFQTKEIAIKGRTELIIELFNEDFNTYYGTVLMPLGNQSRSSVTSSVVTTGRTSNTSYESIEQKFAGEIPGMHTIMRSGSPGIGGNMFIRGYSSLNGSSQPLVIVDGMLLETNSYSPSLNQGHQFNPLSDIDIKDIANITVIKDAVSVYGSKAANGVILIETTRSKDISTKIDFQVQGGLNYTPQFLPMMDASQYKSYLVDQLGSSKLYSDAELSKLPFLNENRSFSEYSTYHNNTNWQDQVFKNSYSKDYHLRITGGDEVAKYGLSLGYMDHAGIISNTGFKRFNTRFNADSYITSKLSFSTNLSVSYQSNSMRDDGMIQRSSPLYAALIKSPMLSPYVADDRGTLTSNYAGVDSIGHYSNPKALINSVTGDNKNYGIFGNIKFVYKFKKDLHLSTLIGVNFLKNSDNIFLPANGISSGITTNGDLTFRSSGVSAERQFSIYNDTRLTYSRKFGRIHDLLFNLGVRYNQNNYEDSWSTSGNSGDDQFTALQSGNKLTSITSGSIGNWKWASLYANVDYGFLNKYFVSANLSMDGSSRFGKNAKDGISLFSNKFGIFPSIGGAWLVSSENFMAHHKLIDQLKLRASYGITGNDGIGNYTAQSYFVSKRFLEGTGLVSGNLANSEIQWERTSKANLGFNLGLFNERLALTFDLFNHVTDRLLNLKVVNPLFGYTNYLNNDGKLRNRGFEFNINARVLNSSSFKWDLGFNISKFQNEILSLPDGKNVVDLTSINATILNQEGSPLGLFYGYKTDGIYKNSTEAAADGLTWKDYKGFQQPFRAGDVRFVNTVGSDKIINSDDRVVIGNPNPDFTGMISNKFTYKRWSLDAMMTFSKGNDIYNALRAQNESMSGFANQSQAATRRWRVEDQLTDIPRAEYGDPTGNARFSDRWIEDGSYIRLKSLSLTYSPEFKSGFVRNATIFITANNLLTVTRYLGYDPEVSLSGITYTQGIDAGLTPQFKSVFIGIRLGL